MGSSSLFSERTPEEEAIRIAKGAKLSSDKPYSGPAQQEAAQKLLAEQAEMKETLIRSGWSLVVVGAGLGVGYGIPFWV